MMRKLITSAFAVLLVLLVMGCEGPIAPTSDDEDSVLNSTANQTVIVTVINHDHDDDGGTTPPPSTNRPPVLLSPGQQTNIADTVAVVTMSASDPDGDALTWTATGLPRGLFIDQGGVITGLITTSSSDDSPFNCFVTVSDSNGGRDQVSFLWVVLPALP